MLSTNSNNNLSYKQKNFQHQQELQDKQSRENLANFIKNSGENVYSIREEGKLNNDYINGPHFLNRRRSYGPIASSPLRPVHESRSSSPTFQFQTQNLCANQVSTQNERSFQHVSCQKITKASSSFNMKSNMRQFHTGSLGSIGSFEAGQNSGLSSVLSNFSNLKFSDSNLEEKLATTGNIFQQRENWSIINKLPIDKQNTIHIRLEDEGPYGNDETRCFVLSHLSKLGIKELNCLFCSCLMPVYDRFPLVDGTLFASPYSYDTQNQIPVLVSEKHQFINGICLKCLNGSDSKHEIKCKHCNESWQKFGKQIQIGTFYKYDLLAANPCCQMRVNCNKCNKQLLDLQKCALPYFSLYSEKTKCPYCFSEDYHFIKELNKIFLEKKCDKIRED